LLDRILDPFQYEHFPHLNFASLFDLDSHLLQESAFGSTFVAVLIFYLIFLVRLILSSHALSAQRTNFDWLAEIAILVESVVVEQLGDQCSWSHCSGFGPEPLWPLGPCC